MRRLGWILFGVALFCVCPFFCAHAAPKPPRRALLEFSIEERQVRFAAERAVYGAETAFVLGFGWGPTSWFAVHGSLNAAWLWLPEGGLVSHYQNDVVSDSHLGSLGLEASIDLMLPDGVAGISAMAGGRSYFARYRAGIFVLYAGCGLFGQPVFRDTEGLRGIRFGADVRFWLLDHFGKIFGAQADRPELVIYVRFAL